MHLLPQNVLYLQSDVVSLEGSDFSVVYSDRAFCNLSTDILYVPTRLGDSPNY